MDRTLAKGVLEDAGHALTYASSGDAALKVYKTQTIDLVITDLAMPQLNGIRLIEELRAHDESALIIAVTGVSPEQLERAQKLGAAVTLRKPYAAQVLLAAVTKLLEARAEERPDHWY